MAIRLDLGTITDEDLLRLSERNPGYQFERTADGRLLVTPTGMESGRRSLEIAYQLKRWNEQTGLGIVFDSSTGFRLPDGSLFSPDASWIPKERWEALRPEEREKFGAFCPDAVFEVLSSSQVLEELREKMRVYIRNGARIAVLIDPYARVVEIYRPGQDPELHRAPAHVSLSPELPDFALDLRPIFEG
ncbi:Uma2 family endonuclease [Thermoflexus sp.]|uniref:Uma2 family endonuclease n=1 Tax=Thermoflexus sp. TaxID=1969742 RepID=UPI002ADDB140|nr:Uma2 family endonuclease [Thermoflexus sp.]